MQKVMKVKLLRMRSASAEHGKIYASLEWEIPFESLESKDEPKKASPLEAEMISEVHAAMPPEYHASVRHMMYGDLSSGGSLGHGEYTLTVGFGEADILYKPR